MLEILIAVLVIFWLGGFALHVGGSFIHILIIVAVVIFIIRMMRGRE